MEEKLLQKMLRNTFYQYQHDSESIPVTDSECQALMTKIKKLMEVDPSAEIYDIINDVVYEYLTS